MKKLHRKSLVLLITLAVLLTCAVSGTAAYLAIRSGPVTNTFTRAELDTVIVEEFSKKNGKVSIKVENKGDIDAYVRVGVYGYWAVQDGNDNEKVVAPWTSAVKYTEDWKQVGDWYYYTKKLAPDALTSNLLKESIKEENAPVHYPSAYLVVNVIHQSIQAEPVGAVQDAWGWTPPAAAQ